jgi:hypothetical protein
VGPVVIQTTSVASRNDYQNGNEFLPHFLGQISLKSAIDPSCETISRGMCIWLRRISTRTESD